jgi:hypothetical protein
MAETITITWQDLEKMTEKELWDLIDDIKIALYNKGGKNEE